VKLADFRNWHVRGANCTWLLIIYLASRPCSDNAVNLWIHFSVRGCQYVSDSVYESPYNGVDSLAEFAC
jgi:hypothetical protein